jgi:hypothetical protein
MRALMRGKSAQRYSRNVFPRRRIDTAQLKLITLLPVVKLGAKRWANGSLITSNVNFNLRKTTIYYIHAGSSTAGAAEKSRITTCNSRYMVYDLLLTSSLRQMQPIATLK